MSPISKACVGAAVSGMCFGLGVSLDFGFMSFVFGLAAAVIAISAAKEATAKCR